jgi:hypothetical protein
MKTLVNSKKRSNMKTKLISIIKSILTLGLGFATCMATWAYYDGKEFQLIKFILDATLFGFFMSFVCRQNSNTEIKTADKESRPN